MARLPNSQLHSLRLEVGVRTRQQLANNVNQLIQSIKILNASELKQINTRIDEKAHAFKGSAVMKDDGTAGTKNAVDIRSSELLSVRHGSEIDQLLHRKMEVGLQKYRDIVAKVNTMFQHWPVPGSVDTFFGREPIQVLRYKPGQRYVFHHDQADFQDRPEYYRTLSTVLYLNDGFEGGGTEFPHKTFKPKAGYALFFPSNWCYPHSGQEVLSGEKRVAVTWWYALREPQG